MLNFSFNRIYLYVFMMSITNINFSSCQYIYAKESDINKTETNIKDQLIGRSESEESWEGSEARFIEFSNTLIRYLDSCDLYKDAPDSFLCKTIIHYYLRPNPLDGYIGENQAILIYELFYENNALCNKIDYYLNEMMIEKKTQDTLWVRIAFDIIGNIWMNESWDETEYKKKFPFFEKRGYFVDDYRKYFK